MSNHFIEWLYKQVTHEPPSGRQYREEWYLYNNHFDESSDEHGFVHNLEQSLSNVSFTGLDFQVGEKYGSGITTQLDTKFNSVHDLV